MTVASSSTVVAAMAAAPAAAAAVAPQPAAAAAVAPQPVDDDDDAAVEARYEAAMAADKRVLDGAPVHPSPDGVHAPTLSDAELAFFHEHGFISLGRAAPLAAVEALGERIDDLMLGNLTLPRPMLWQLCPSASDLPQFAEHGGAQSKVWKGSTLRYRKIQDLEQDDLYVSAQAILTAT